MMRHVIRKHYNASDRGDVSLSATMNAPTNDDSGEKNARATASKRPWAQSELFCVHSYAGESGPPCGWLGLSSETARDPATGMRRCPRCGRATLMDIPFAKA